MPSTVAIYPNLTTNDEVMRKLFHDRRFRQALSLGVNRHEVNKILYYGLGCRGRTRSCGARPVTKSPEWPTPGSIRPRPIACSTRWV